MKNPLRPRRKASECEHEWFLYGTSITNRKLLLECPHCGSLGVVEDPSDVEWERSFSAARDPYRWTDVSRVKDLGLT